MALAGNPLAAIRRRRRGNHERGEALLTSQTASLRRTTTSGAFSAGSKPVSARRPGQGALPLKPFKRIFKKIIKDLQEPLRAFKAAL